MRKGSITVYLSLNLLLLLSLITAGLYSARQAPDVPEYCAPLPVR